jgi:two-component system NtrC family sensor kinase
VVSTRELGSSVRVSIADTGAGIDADNLDRVFEPGFTTKGRGVGTGLGLAICYQIVRDHDGDIGLVSEPGGGTTVNIDLPLDGPSLSQGVSR